MNHHPVVNAHNGWAPLEEIIVGAPFHLDYANDLSFWMSSMWWCRISSYR